MKILVTGANGFVGSALCSRLSTEGITVHAAVRSPSSAPPASPMLCPFAVGEIGEETDWGKALTGVDVVIHLAARVHMMRDDAANPLGEFLNTNHDATVNLARQAAAAGAKRFVYLSSIKVNGEYTHHEAPFRETDAPNPQDPYAISKLSAEEALRAISSETGMGVVIVRPPLVYGPKVKANFAKLLKLVDKGIPLPLGRVENQRSLVFVGNLCDALLQCALNPAAAGRTYLISDGEDVSTAELVRGMAFALNRPARLVPVPVIMMRTVAKLLGKRAAVERLTQSLVVDNSSICRELAWSPPYSLAQGLQLTADWYHSCKSGQSE